MPEASVRYEERESIATVSLDHLAGSVLLGRPVAALAAVEGRALHRPARDRDSLASQGLPPPLASHPETRLRAAIVSTVRFRLLRAWFVLDHGRRRLLHIDVTSHPTSEWVIRQLREAFPGEPRCRYRIHDDDSIFSGDVTRAIESLRLVPARTAYRSPWQNGSVERRVGSPAGTHKTGTSRVPNGNRTRAVLSDSG